jgi:hypothetical protein
MKTSVEYVTPALAQHYLDNNASFQRKVRQGTVRTYAEAMKRGEWKLTHQGIAIDVNGKTVDGQHRLLAVVMSGVTVPMTVVTGVAGDVFSVLDIGQKRDIADLLHIPKRDAAMVSYTGRIFLSNKKLSSSQALSVYELLEDHISAAAAVQGQARNVYSSAPAGLALALHCWDKPNDRERVETLFKNMAESKVEELPPVAISLITQVARGAVNAGSEAARKDVLFRMFYVLDPSKADVPRAAVGTEYVAARSAYFRDKITGLISI